MKNTYILVRLPSWLHRAVRELSRSEGTSAEQICSDALIDHLQQVAPDLIPDDAPIRNQRNMTIRLANKILADAIDASARQLVIEEIGDEFVIYGFSGEGRVELGHWPAPWLSTIRQRYQFMARRGGNFILEHNGEKRFAIHLDSTIPSIVLRIEEKER